MIEESVEVGLREVAAAREELDVREQALVARARSHGATWSDLAGPLGLTKQGARKRHLAIDPIFARRALRAPTIEEYHEEMVAALRAQGVSLE